MFNMSEANVIMRRGKKLAVLNKAGETRNEIVSYCLKEFEDHARVNFKSVLDRLAQDKPEHYMRLFQTLIRNETMTETLDKEELNKQTNVLVTFNGGKKNLGNAAD